VTESVATGVVVAAAAAAALVVGWIVDAVLVARLRRSAETRGRRWGVALAKALRGQPEIWSVVITIALLPSFGVLSHADNALLLRLNAVAAIVSVTLFAARLAGWVIRGYLRQGNAPSGTIFVNLARAVVWVVGLLLVLGTLGVEVGPLIASLGIAGLAISLGLQDTLANVFNGLQLTLTRDIQPGDVVRLSSGEEGVVEDITWRATTLRSPSDDVVLVPNAFIGRSVVTRLSGAEAARSVIVPFTVVAATDLSRACDVALEVATEVQARVPSAVGDFEPTCRSRGFEGGGITLAVTLRVEAYGERFAVIDAFVRELHDRYHAEGIEFASPPMMRSGR